MVTIEKIRNIFLPSIIQSPYAGGKAGAITGISIFSLETNRSPRRTRNRSRIDFIRAGIIDAMEFMNKVFPLIIEVPLLLCFFFSTRFFLTKERWREGERGRENKGGKRVSYRCGRIESHGLSSISFFPLYSTILHGGFDGSLSRFFASWPRFLNFIFLGRTLVCHPSWQGNDALNEYRWYWRVPGQSDNGLNFAAVGRQSFGFLTSRHNIDSLGETLSDFLLVHHCEIARTFLHSSPIVGASFFAFFFRSSSVILFVLDCVNKNNTNIF